VACGPAKPSGHKRPGNVSPERLAAIAQGVLIEKVDGSLAAVTAACLEGLESFRPACDVDLARRPPASPSG
jgi:hypothetical protein